MQTQFEKTKSNPFQPATSFGLKTDNDSNPSSGEEASLSRSNSLEEVALASETSSIDKSLDQLALSQVRLGNASVVMGMLAVSNPQLETKKKEALEQVLVNNNGLLSSDEVNLLKTYQSNLHVPVNLKDETTGSNIILIAVENGHSHLVPVLLELGANPLSENKAGKTALSCAAQQRDVACLTHLHKYLSELDFINVDAGKVNDPIFKQVIDNLTRLKNHLVKYSEIYTTRLTWNLFFQFISGVWFNLSDRGNEYAAAYAVLYKDCQAIDPSHLLMKLRNLIREADDAAGELHAGLARYCTQLEKLLSDNNFTAIRDSYMLHKQKDELQKLRTKVAEQQRAITRKDRTISKQETEKSDAQKQIDELKQKMEQQRQEMEQKMEQQNKNIMFLLQKAGIDVSVSASSQPKVSSTATSLTTSRNSLSGFWNQDTEKGHASDQANTILIERDKK